MKIVKKSTRFFRKIFRFLLVGIFAFLAYGCPTPDYGAPYPVPAYGVPAPEYGVPSVQESTIVSDSNLNEEESQ